MFYLSGARLLPDEQVRIASTKIHGIGPKKAIQLFYRFSLSGNTQHRFMWGGASLTTRDYFREESI
jgi:hypothetical protein